ncbi:MAG: hypothetical protein M1352_02315 [Patescibacteria group bacterium]|nr:hypothetical protein [Patescibacteria group bacterium]
MRVFKLIISLAFIFLALSLVGILSFKFPATFNKTAVKSSGVQNFSGRVLRISPSEENYILDLMDLEATSAASRITKSFSVKKESSGTAVSQATDSASKDSFTTSFGNVRIGDILKVTYSGEASPYKILSLENTSAKEDIPPQPAFLHGIVSSISGTTMTMYSTESGTYTLRVDGTVLMGPMYEKVGGVERPGKLKPVKDFSSLKVWQEISVFYSRNDGEVIIPDSVLTF